MKNLTRSTGCLCLACNKGTIIEEFTIHYAHPSGEIRLGAPQIPVRRWVTSKFNCDHCGQEIKPTTANKVVPFEHTDRILELTGNYYDGTILNRDISWNEILSESRKKIELAQGTIVYKHIPQKSVFDFERKKKKMYLVIKANRKPTLFDPAKVARDQYEKLIKRVLPIAKEKAEKKSVKHALKYIQKYIPEAEYHEKLKTFGYPATHAHKADISIPEAAVLAEYVCTMNEDFKMTRYVIPADSISKEEDNVED